MKTSTNSHCLRVLLIGSSMLASLFTGTGTSYSAPRTAPVLQQTPVCTTQLGQTILVKLKNNTSAKINAVAVGTDCREDTRERLEAGWEVSLVTQVGQVWSFWNADTNQRIDTIALSEQRAYATIVVGDSVQIVAAPDMASESAAAPTAEPEPAATAPPAPTADASESLVARAAALTAEGSATSDATTDHMSISAATSAAATAVPTSTLDDPQLMSVKVIADPRSIQSWGGSTQVEANPRSIQSWGGPSSDGYRKNQKVFSSLGLDRVGTLSNGEGVVVAVLDTGFQLDHPMLAGSFTDFRYDFVDRDTDPTDVKNGIDNDHNGFVDEAYGHGTHIAGIIHLIAPKAKIMPFRVLNADGDGNLANVVTAMYAAVLGGANIINLSLGTTVDSPQLRRAVLFAKAAGVMVIAASGNLDLWPKQYPAADSCAIAVTSSGQVQNFLNILTNNGQGKWIDFAAPGENVYSTFPGSTYATWSGSSMATPIVAAIAALNWSRYPKASDRQIIQLVNATSDVLKVGLLPLLPLGPLNQLTYEDVSRLGLFAVGFDGSFNYPYVRRSPDADNSLLNADSYFAGKYKSALTRGGGLSDCLIP